MNNIAYNFLNTYSVSTDGVESDVDKVFDHLNGKNRGFVINTINAHSTCVAEDDNKFQNALKTSNLLLPDGISIVLGLRLLSKTHCERVSGYDFFTTVCKKANERKSTTFCFLGSSEKTLEKIKKKLQIQYPNINIVGLISPPFKDQLSQEDNEKIFAQINNIQPEFLWVGMTAPKQEKWIYDNLKFLDVGAVAAIGAVFDFYSGTKKRAPQFMQRLGLEWLHRLISEPKRVWRRYLINNTRFIIILLKFRLGLK